jgi:hypothetical protein
MTMLQPDGNAIAFSSPYCVAVWHGESVSAGQASSERKDCIDRVVCVCVLTRVSLSEVMRGNNFRRIRLHVVTVSGYACKVQYWILGAAVHGCVLVAIVHRGCSFQIRHRSIDVCVVILTESWRRMACAQRRLQAHAQHVSLHVESAHRIKRAFRAKGGTTPTGGNLEQPVLRLDISWVNNDRSAEAGRVLWAW